MKSTGLRYYINERKNNQELRELRTERLIADFLSMTSRSEDATDPKAEGETSDSLTVESSEVARL